VDIELEGHIRYDVTITTGDQKGDGTKSPIKFAILGKLGKGQTKMISEKGFKTSSVETNQIFSTEVGIISGFTIWVQNADAWYVERIVIENYCKNLYKII